MEFVLAKPPRAPGILEAASLDALWSACLPEDGVEHIRVHASRAGARGVLFCLAPDVELAVERSRALCHRAVTERPEFTGWQVARVGPPY
ncbi:hypothetical protein AB6O49_15885 [Streptomyces sp. SBR177]